VPAGRRADRTTGLTTDGAPIVAENALKARFQTPHSLRIAVAGPLALVAAAPAQAAEGLELVPELEILAALLVLFVMLVAPVNRLIFKPIFAALDEREARIGGTRERARELADESSALLSRYDHALRDVRAEASDDRKRVVADARTAAAARVAEARSGAEGEIERARAELATAIASARSSLRGQTEALAREAAARVLGRPVS